MRICDKIKFMRQAKSLSQEEMAEKLGLSINGYANIERGETDALISRIQQIAKVFEMDFMELVSFGERNVICLTRENHSYNNLGIILNTTPADVKHDLEKSQIIIEAQCLEIAHLKEIIELMKELNPHQST